MAKLTPENRRKTGVKKLRGGHEPSIGKATQFRPGVCPNPNGRPATQPIVAALREVMNEHPEMLKQIAERALRKARSNVRWFGEVRDMLDGRPTQAVVFANPEDEKFQVEVTSARNKLLALFSGPAATDDTRRDP